MNNIAIYANASKSEAIFWAEKAVERLKSLGVNCCAEPHIAERFSPGTAELVERAAVERFGHIADMVIAFGGDGTMLAAAQKLAETDIPLMGVNVGKLGFLAEFSTKELDEALDSVLSGSYRIVDRSLLQSEIDGRIVYALNEFAVERDNSPKTLDIRLSVGNHPVADYRSDGVIISTPTGSTAYSLSCGGPVIAPSAPVICITPISAHSLTMRPLIIPDTLDVGIEIVAAEGGARLTADGFVEKILNKNDAIVVRNSEMRIKLVKHTSTTYFDLLRAKFLWSASGISEKYPENGGR